MPSRAADSVASLHPRLAVEWHPTMNHGLNAADVPASSPDSAWWLCPEGHSFRTKVSWRCAAESGCPVCSGRRTRPGVNDLATIDPDLAAQWHARANWPLTPQTVSPGFKGEVMWLDLCGHTFERSPSARRQDRRCPVCLARVAYPGQNDLASQHPDLAAEWAASLNGGLQPDEVTVASRKRIRWQRVCDHPFVASPASRIADPTVPGCDRCARTGPESNPRLTETVDDRPGLLVLWDAAANAAAGLDPTTIKAGDNRTKVSWRCPAGHTWMRAPRTQRDYCKVCAGEDFLPGVNDLATKRPDLAAEWHPEQNDGLAPSEVPAQSNRSVWWVCSRCGHEWETRVANRTARGSGCPTRCSRRL